MENDSFENILEFKHWNGQSLADEAFFRRRAITSNRGRHQYRMSRVEDTVKRVKTITERNGVSKYHVSARSFRKGNVTMCFTLGGREEKAEQKRIMDSVIRRGGKWTLDSQVPELFYRVKSADIGPYGRVDTWEQAILLGGEWTHKDCRDKQPLPFDLLVFKELIEWLFELDGIQHFRPYKDTEKRRKEFAYMRGHDILKMQWALSKRDFDTQSKTWDKDEFKLGEVYDNSLYWNGEEPSQNYLFLPYCFYDNEGNIVDVFKGYPQSLFGSMPDRMSTIFPASSKVKFWLVSSDDLDRLHDFAWDEISFQVGLYFIHYASELEQVQSARYPNWDPGDFRGTTRIGCLHNSYRIGCCLRNSYTIGCCLHDSYTIGCCPHNS
jgi:hypothetical protein